MTVALSEDMRAALIRSLLEATRDGNEARVAELARVLELADRTRNVRLQAGQEVRA